MASSYHDLVTRIRATGTETFVGQMKKAGKSVETFNNQTVRTKKTGGAASQAIINLGRGASDARYGFHGLANNLEFITEMLGQAYKEAGSTGGVFKQLGASLLGPAGLVAGISILIAYGPEIVSFFKNAADPASKLKGEVEDLTIELNKLRQEYGLTSGDTIEDKILKKWDEIIAKQDEYIKKLKQGGDENRFTGGFGSTTYIPSPTNEDQVKFAELQQTINKVVKEQDEEIIEANKSLKKQKELGETLLKNKRRELELYVSQGKSAIEVKKKQMELNKAIIDNPGISGELKDELIHKNKVLQNEIIVLQKEAEEKKLDEQKKADEKKLLQIRKAAERAREELERAQKKEAEERKKWQYAGLAEDDKTWLARFNALKEALDKEYITWEQFLNELDNLNKNRGKGGKLFAETKEYNEIIMLNDALASSFTDLGTSIANFASDSKSMFASFLGAAVQGLTKYISAQIVATAKIKALRKAQASADAIKAATDSAAAIPGVGAFVLPALIGAALASVTSAFSGGSAGGGGRPSFAGGNVRDTGITPRAFQNNPLNNQIQGELVARGTDLVYVFNKANGIRNQYIGG